MAANAGFGPIESPPGADLSADQGPRIVASSIAFLAIPTVIVTLRFVARMLSRAGLWWDDWMVLAALVISWGPNVVLIYTTTHGFGKHIAAIPDLIGRVDEAEWWFQMLYAYQTLYTVAITLAKFSILLFYSRIFKERKFQVCLKVVFGLVTAWFIAVEIASLAECVPITALWDPTVSGKCIDLLAMFKGAGAPNVVFNFIILVMPLPMIWSLEIDLKHKLGLSAVFLLGSFVVVVSIIRLVIFANVEITDITWEFVNAAIWNSAEPSIAVASASLPILRSLFVWRGSKLRTAIRGGAASPESFDEAKIAANRYRREQKRGRHHRLDSKSPPGMIKKDDSFSSQHYPLRDLPEGARHVLGNRVVVAGGSSSRKISDEDDQTWGALPIMHPQEAAYGASFNRRAQPPPPPAYPSLPDNRSELYG